MKSDEVCEINRDQMVLKKRSKNNWYVNFLKLGSSWLEMKIEKLSDRDKNFGRNVTFLGFLISNFPVFFSTVKIPENL